LGAVGVEGLNDAPYQSFRDRRLGAGGITHHTIDLGRPVTPFAALFQSHGEEGLGAGRVEIAGWIRFHNHETRFKGV